MDPRSDLGFSARTIGLRRAEIGEFEVVAGNSPLSNVFTCCGGGLISRGVGVGAADDDKEVRLAAELDDGGGGSLSSMRLSNSSSTSAARGIGSSTSGSC